jgi:hypothetical protein
MVFMVFCHSLRIRQRRVSPPKPLPSSPILQQLDRLNRSSPDFHDQLCNIIYGEEYVQSVPSIQGDDLVWLVDYLDRVSRHVALPILRLLSQPRLLVISIFPVPPPESVYVN